MGPKLSFILLFAGLACMIYGSALSTIFYHERAHYDIYTHTGFDNVTMGMDSNPIILHGWTVAELAPKSDLEAARDFNLWHEIISYNILIVVANLWLMLLAYILFKAYLFRGDYDQEEPKNMR